MRVALVSTHRSDRAHYAPLRRLLEADARFALTNPDRIVDQPPDVAVVLGDRVEMLQAAIGFVEARIPLLHIHGGEHTYGSLDQRWRWAMTMIADVHCTATKAARADIIDALGRLEAKHVHVTGAPGLDDIHDRQPFPNAPKIVVLYNPAIDEETTRRESLAILQSVGVAYFIKPNGDRFTEAIPWHNTGEELLPERFRDLLAAAHVIVGNSSAGIIEAPSLGTWTVNVGERQSGRPMADSVVGVPAPAQYVIADTIRMLLERPRAVVANPYGDGHASERIRDVLLEMGK